MTHRYLSHGWLIGLVGIVAALLTSPAQAQQRVREPIDVERFKPAITPDPFVVTEGSAVRPDADRFEFGAFANFALNSLIVVNQDDEVTDRFVETRLGFDVFASATIYGPLAVAIDVPFYVAQTGDEDPDVAGLGDVRIAPKLRILDDREIFGLAAIAELRVPTHVGDYSGGARNVVFVPKLVADHRFGGTGFRMGANAGVSIREGTQFENVSAASEFDYAAAMSYRIGGWDGVAAFGAEVNGGVGLTSVDFEELPLEARIFAKVNPSPEWEVVGGPSMGIVPGYGIPTFRAFVGVRYSPTSHDRDGDGIPDDEDACPDTPEDRDGYQDSDGCPETEDEIDSDGDGIFDSEDLCPGEKETINGIEDDDGCPDKGEQKVIRKERKLEVLENVLFSTGSATISPQSYSILQQVALVLKANPDITKVRVEGHTDSRGSDQANLLLSQARAQSVRKFLIGQGVAADRLEAKGFGETQPIVEEVDDAALQKNRRVEFVIVEELAK